MDREEPAVIEIKSVIKWYGSVQVLTDCSTTIKKGEVVVVCGPSGSGKSTLIKTVEDCKKEDFFGSPDARTPRAREFLSKILQH